MVTSERVGEGRQKQIVIPYLLCTYLKCPSSSGMSVKGALLRLRHFSSVPYCILPAPSPSPFIVVYASSKKKVVKKPLEKFIYDASHQCLGSPKEDEVVVLSPLSLWRRSQNEN
jgi:hypothetical protein